MADRSNVPEKEESSPVDSSAVLYTKEPGHHSKGAGVAALRRLPPSTAPARQSPARQSPDGPASIRMPRPRAAALTRASSRAPPLPPALAAGQLAARVLEERVREEMKWLLPPVVPGSAPAPGPGPGPGDLDPRRRRELFRVFTMVQPGGPGPRRARRSRERRGRPARRRTGAGGALPGRLALPLRDAGPTG